MESRRFPKELIAVIKIHEFTLLLPTVIFLPFP